LLGYTLPTRIDAIALVTALRVAYNYPSVQVLEGSDSAAALQAVPVNAGSVGFAALNSTFLAFLEAQNVECKQIEVYVVSPPDVH